MLPDTLRNFFIRRNIESGKRENAERRRPAYSPDSDFQRTGPIDRSGEWIIFYPRNDPHFDFIGIFFFFCNISGFGKKRKIFETVYLPNDFYIARRITRMY